MGGHDCLSDRARHHGIRYERKVRAVLLKAPDRQYGHPRLALALVARRCWRHQLHDQRPPVWPTIMR